MAATRAAETSRPPHARSLLPRPSANERTPALSQVHLASYLLAEQLDNARFLWKRLPAGREADPELCAIWAVGKALWAKDHAGAQGAITGFSWSPPLMGMIMERLQRQHLARCFAQTVQAYSLVTAEALSQALGVPLDTVHQMASAQGWTTDAETGAYIPSAPEEAKVRQPLFDTLDRLTDYVAHVDREIR